MKKFLTLILTVIISVSFCGCGASNSSKDKQNDLGFGNISSNGGYQKENLSESGSLGEYDIKIGCAKKVIDRDGKPSVIINYEYTNNSKDEHSFIFSVCDIVMQNDKELNNAIILNDESYLPESATKSVAPGATTTVQKAFELRDEISPIRIEVTEFLKPDGEKVVKSFDISNLQ